jgi:hypothetical protein
VETPRGWLSHGRGPDPLGVEHIVWAPWPIAAWTVDENEPRGWDDSEVTALQTYAAVVTSLLGPLRPRSRRPGLLAAYGVTPGHRAGKGALMMEYERLDVQRYSGTCAVGRILGRNLTEVAHEVAVDLLCPGRDQPDPAGERSGPKRAALTIRSCTRLGQAIASLLARPCDCGGGA